MYEEVQVLTHSSIRIAGNQIIYFDPFHVEEETRDADIICVTHEHFDHYSPEDHVYTPAADYVLSIFHYKNFYSSYPILLLMLATLFTKASTSSNVL